MNYPQQKKHRENNWRGERDPTGEDEATSQGAHTKPIQRLYQAQEGTRSKVEGKQVQSNWVTVGGPEGEIQGNVGILPSEELVRSERDDSGSVGERVGGN